MQKAIKKMLRLAQGLTLHRTQPLVPLDQFRKPCLQWKRWNGNRNFGKRF